MYNYQDTMRSDLLDYIAENYTLAEILEKLDDAESWKEELNDNCWTADSVTGNASGSYTFNRWKAKEYVTDNADLCREALVEFCVEKETIADKFLDEEWEYFDVTIRCYILYGAINELVDALSDCREALEAENDRLTADRLAEIIEEAA